jgi:Lhr-like helicase
MIPESIKVEIDHIQRNLKGVQEATGKTRSWIGKERERIDKLEKDVAILIDGLRQTRIAFNILHKSYFLNSLRQAYDNVENSMLHDDYMQAFNNINQDGVIPDDLVNTIIERVMDTGFSNTLFHSIKNRVIEETHAAQLLELYKNDKDFQGELEDIDYTWNKTNRERKIIQEEMSE